MTETPEDRTGPRWGRIAALALVVVVLAAAVWFLVPRGGETIVDETGQEVEVIARTEGFVLTGSRITDEIDPATGEPGEERTTFAPGDPVRYWLSFDDEGAQPGKDTLFVEFTRDGSDGELELFRAPFRLPQPVGQQNVTLGAGQTDEPGEYRITVFVNDEAIHDETFEIR